MFLLSSDASHNKRVEKKTMAPATTKRRRRNFRIRTTLSGRSTRSRDSFIAKMIKAVLVFNNHGKARLSKFFVRYVSRFIAFVGEAPFEDPYPPPVERRYATTNHSRNVSLSEQARRFCLQLSRRRIVREGRGGWGKKKLMFCPRFQFDRWIRFSANL